LKLYDGSGNALNNERIESKRWGEIPFAQISLCASK
jgi:hypothetical protein